MNIKELEKVAREKKLSLAVIEKDWVLLWVLKGIAERAKNLVFTGGTALSKVYFPKIWRLSEDLDFTVNPDSKVSNEEIIDSVRDGLILTKNQSRIDLNPGRPHVSGKGNYIQIYVKYSHEGIASGKIKIDITRDLLIDKIRHTDVLKVYPDPPQFRINVKSLEEILASKLVALSSRDKVRDYYDIWLLLTNTEVNIEKSKEILNKYLKFHSERQNKKLEISEESIFPKNIEETLRPYWERDIKRLSNPSISLEEMLGDLKKALKEKAII